MILSEIEASNSAEWTLTEICERSNHLLAFMSERRGLNLSDEDIEELTHLQQYFTKEPEVAFTEKTNN